MISGFEVLDWVRRQPGLREVPVVVFSPSGRPEDRRRAEELGANQYVLKPASGSDFVELVREIRDGWLL
jgi:CheY-like chemotaxis protein